MAGNAGVIADVISEQVARLFASGVLTTFPVQSDLHAYKQFRTQESSTTVTTGGSATFQIDTNNGALDMGSITLVLEINPRLGTALLNSSNFNPTGLTVNNYLSTSDRTAATQSNYISLTNPNQFIKSIEVSISGVNWRKFTGVNLPYSTQTVVDRMINDVDNGAPLHSFDQTNSNLFFSEFNLKQLQIYAGNLDDTNHLFVHIPIRDGILLRSDLLSC